MPINKIDYIVNSMKNSKINGNRVIVKKVDMKKDIRNVNKNKKQKNKSHIYKKG